MQEERDNSNAPLGFRHFVELEEALGRSDLEAAKGAFERLEALGIEDADLMTALGECLALVEDGDWLEALHWLEIHEFIGESFLRESFGMFLGRHFEEEDQVLYAVNAYLGTARGQQRAEELAMEEEAILPELRGMFLQDALERYEAQAEKTPKDAETWLALGIFRVYADPENALECLERAIECDPQLYRAYEGVLMLFLMAEEGEDIAVEWLEDRCESMPEEASLWNSLGKLYLMLDQKDAARQAFERVQALDPADVLVWKRWLECVDPCDELNIALEGIRAAIALNPSLRQKQLGAAHALLLLEQCDDELEDVEDWRAELEALNEEVHAELMWLRDALSGGAEERREFRFLLHLLHSLDKEDEVSTLLLEHIKSLDEDSESHFFSTKLLQHAFLFDKAFELELLKEELDRRRREAPEPVEQLRYVQDLIELNSVLEERGEGEAPNPEAGSFGLWQTLLDDLVEMADEAEDPELRVACNNIMLMIFIVHLELAQEHAIILTNEKIPLEGDEEGDDEEDLGGLSAHEDNVKAFLARNDRRNEHVEQSSNSTNWLLIVVLFVIAVALLLMKF